MSVDKICCRSWFLVLVLVVYRNRACWCCLGAGLGKSHGPFFFYGHAASGVSEGMPLIICNEGRERVEGTSRPLLRAWTRGCAFTLFFSCFLIVSQDKCHLHRQSRTYHVGIILGSDNVFVSNGRDALMLAAGC